MKRVATQSVSGCGLNGREQGSTLVTVTLFIVALFGFAALSLDVSNVLKQQRTIHAAADMSSFAGAGYLKNNPGSPASAVIGEARVVALANGLTDAEIAAGASGGFPGQIQVGVWNFTSRTFTPNATPVNAVRVPARRTVQLAFGGVIGINTMNPVVHSVSALGTTGSFPPSSGVIPFGISVSELAGKNFGDTLTMNDPGIGSGKWGKLDLNSYQTPGEWRADVNTNGVPAAVSVGIYPTITGNAQVRQAWAALPPNAIVIIPVADQFDTTGSKPANIVGFVQVQLISFSGRGNNWTATVRFLNNATGGGPGGTCPPPCVSDRYLVQ